MAISAIFCDDSSAGRSDRARSRPTSPRRAAMRIRRRTNARRCPSPWRCRAPAAGGSGSPARRGRISAPDPLLLGRELRPRVRRRTQVAVERDLAGLGQACCSAAQEQRRRQAAACVAFAQLLEADARQVGPLGMERVRGVGRAMRAGAPRSRQARRWLAPRRQDDERSIRRSDAPRRRRRARDRGKRIDDQPRTQDRRSARASVAERVAPVSARVISARALGRAALALRRAQVDQDAAADGAARRSVANDEAVAGRGRDRRSSTSCTYSVSPGRDRLVAQHAPRGAGTSAAA